MTCFLMSLMDVQVDIQVVQDILNKPPPNLKRRCTNTPSNKHTMATMESMDSKATIDVLNVAKQYSVEEIQNLLIKRLQEQVADLQGNVLELYENNSHLQNQCDQQLDTFRTIHTAEAERDNRQTEEITRLRRQNERLQSQIDVQAELTRAMERDENSRQTARRRHPDDRSGWRRRRVFYAGTDNEMRELDQRISDLAPFDGGTQETLPEGEVQRRVRIMEEIEARHEAGTIDEGQYLEEMNQLRA